VSPGRRRVPVAILGMPSGAKPGRRLGRSLRCRCARPHRGPRSQREPAHDSHRTGVPTDLRRPLASTVQRQAGTVLTHRIIGTIVRAAYDLTRVRNERVRGTEDVRFPRHRRVSLLVLALHLLAGPLALWSHDHRPHGCHESACAHGLTDHATGGSGGCQGHQTRGGLSACPFAARRATAPDAVRSTPSQDDTRADSGACASCEFLAQSMAGGAWSPPVVSSPVRQAEATHAPAFAPRPPAAPFFARGPPA